MWRRTFLLGLGATALASSFESRSDSPLGTIAYILKDGLWLRDLPDGRPRRLVAHEKLQYPKFSATGDSITYYTDRDCTRQYRISRSGGTPTRVTRPDRRIFTADHALYAYVRELGRIDPNTPHNQLWISNASGPPRLVLDDHATLDLWGWSRDNKFLIYWREPYVTADIADGLHLFCVPIATGKPFALGLSSLVNEDFLAISPAADIFAVTAGEFRETWTNKRIVLVDPQTGNHTLLTQKTTAALYPSFSRHGASIAYCAEPDAEIAENDARLARGVRTYKIMQPNGTVKTMPDTPETRIGVADPLPYMKQRRIWIADISNPQRQKQITNDPRYHDEKPMWSHDGTSILFCRLQNADQGTLWLMNADGSNAAKLTPDLYFDRWAFYYGYNTWPSVFDWHQPASESTRM